MLSALTRRLPGLILGIRDEALVPADDAEGAVSGDGGVHERLARLAREAREQLAAGLVVEAVHQQIGGATNRYVFEVLKKKKVAVNVFSRDSAGTASSA